MSKKYNYDKNLFKDYGVGPFMNQVKTRNAEIEKGKEEIPQSIYNANKLAAALHPKKQFVIISKVIDRKGAKSYVLVPNRESGTKRLAYFRAGQYVSVDLNVDGATLSKPYSICSSPKDVLDSSDSHYIITVKEVDNGYASKYILDNWKVGDKVTISGPLGQFNYESIRDAKHVIAAAGGSAITPFYSMAKAIADGTEDFTLTILYGSRTADGILLKDELDEVEKASNGKVKIVHVLSDEEKSEYEHGFITADLIKKYAKGEDYSLFVCGPKPMCEFLNKQIDILNLPQRRVRKEVEGETLDPTKLEGFNKELADKTFKVTVRVRDNEKEIECKGNETLLVAMEKAGIKAPSHCRSGSCGFCHSLLVSGTVFIPKESDGRREADVKFNWIHPCVSYPTSDIVIDVPALL